MVKYRGWPKQARSEPLALVIDIRQGPSAYHNRIRVMWVDDPPPVQASALSSSGTKITTWINPKHFEVVNDCD